MQRNTVYPQLIARAIDEFRQSHPYGPSISEIAAVVGLTIANAQRYIRLYDGVLWQRTPGVARSIVTLPIKEKDYETLT